MNTWAMIWREMRRRHTLDYVLVLAMIYAVVVHFSYVWSGMTVMGDGNALRGLPFMLGAALPAFVTVGVFGLVCGDVVFDSNRFGVHTLLCRRLSALQRPAAALAEPTV